MKYLVTPALCLFLLFTTIPGCGKAAQNQEYLDSNKQIVAKDTTPEVKTPEKATPKASPENQWKDTVTITIAPREDLEYKFFVEKGATLEYSWKTDGGLLFYDFHGEPDGDMTGYFKSYKKTTENASSGTLSAPFAGSHGWYWKNNGAEAVKVTLQTRGEYRVLGLVK